MRSKAKGDYLSNLFSGKPFSFVLVEDLADKNGFDKVMADQSFDGVLHTASPFHYRVDKPEELIEVCVCTSRSLTEGADFNLARCKRHHRHLAVYSEVWQVERQACGRHLVGCCNQRTGDQAAQD